MCVEGMHWVGGYWRRAGEGSAHQWGLVLMRSKDEESQGDPAVCVHGCMGVSLHVRTSVCESVCVCMECDNAKQSEYICVCAHLCECR